MEEYKMSKWLENPYKEFEGKKVLVTGGTKGMGQAVVNRLSIAGATVMTTARAVSAEFPESNLFIQADITTLEGVVKVIQGVTVKWRSAMQFL
jgi:NAD(P)-dependent dehydrogenase (short-subunit alcohol dehydrogenase family)